MNIGDYKGNLLWLAESPYPGRGIVMGKSETGESVQIYWIMGRSENSRNRIFGVSNNDTILFTEAADPSKVQDPSLIIYNAMQGSETCAVVSNGRQTDDVLDRVEQGHKFSEALAGWQYEPDKPHFTPRITGIIYFPYHIVNHFEFAMLRKSLFDDSCERFLWVYPQIPNCFGYCLTTYWAGICNPLPSFTGEPLLMPLMGDIDAIANTYWQALNEENRVSLAVKFILPTGQSRIKVINKYTKV